MGKLRTSNPMTLGRSVVISQGYAYKGEMLSLKKEGNSDTSVT